MEEPVQQVYFLHELFHFSSTVIHNGSSQERPGFEMIDYF